jgi:hypothetical protein
MSTEKQKQKESPKTQSPSYTGGIMKNAMYPYVNYYATNPQQNLALAHS